MVRSTPLDAAPPEPLPQARSKRRRWFNYAVLVVAIGSVIAFDPSALFVVPAVFVLVVPFEKLFPRHDQRVRRKGAGTDIAYALLTPLIAAIGLAVALVIGVLSLAWLPGLLLSPLVAQIPGPLLPVVAFLLFDLTVYWVHRWSHEVLFLWRFHAVHHSPAELDWVSGFRNHPADGAILAPAFIFLIAAGFDPEIAGALAVVQIVIGLFLHANVRWRWRPLHRLVITPEFHHWHHADYPESIHTNYSVFLPLWDLLFGTYHMPRDRRPERYGISEPMPEGLLAQMVHPLRGLPTPWWVVRHPVAATRRLIAALGRGLRQIRESTLRPRNLVPQAF